MKKSLLLILVLFCAPLGACRKGEVTGTVTYLDRAAFPPGAQVQVALQDVSKQDAPAAIVSEQTIRPSTQVPIAFRLPYEKGKIDPKNRYVVRATIRDGQNLFYVTDRSYPVLTQGSPDKVDLVLVRPAVPAPIPASAPATTPSGEGAKKLEETYWKLTSLAEGPIDPAKMNREAHLQFSLDGRVSGTGGCNRLIGSYQREGDKLSFGPLAGTKMACPPETDVDGPLSEALSLTRSFKIEGEKLTLLNEKGKVVAEFQARNG